MGVIQALSRTLLGAQAKPFLEALKKVPLEAALALREDGEASDGRAADGNCVAGRGASVSDASLTGADGGDEAAASGIAGEEVRQTVDGWCSEQDRMRQQTEETGGVERQGLPAQHALFADEAAFERQMNSPTRHRPSPGAPGKAT